MNGRNVQVKFSASKILMSKRNLGKTYKNAVN